MVFPREEKQTKETRRGETEVGLQRGAQCIGGRPRAQTPDQSAIVVRIGDGENREILLEWAMVGTRGSSSSSAQRATRFAG